MVKIKNVDYITLKELSKEYREIGISYSRLRGLIREGVILNYEKIGNLIFIPLEDSLKLLKKKKRDY